ncbi:glutamine amidotransferase-related protein [Candidatus Tremblayella endosymbiont of Pseudococcus viburni]
MRRTCATAPVASNGHGSPREALQHGSHHCTALCLGHQVVCSAPHPAGQGHRGANNPALYLCCRAVLVVTQNHGVATDPSTLGDGVKVTHISLRAQTIQGLRDPAACKWCAGPQDARRYLWLNA